MPVAPSLTSEQRQIAARRSLELRRYRAQIKRDLADQNLSLRMILHWKAVEGMKVADLLAALPGYGKAKVAKVMRQAGIPEKNTVRACGPKQAERLFSLI